MFVQTNTENKFLGEFLWKCWDYVSFGQFSRKHLNEFEKSKKKEISQPDDKLAKK